MWLLVSTNYRPWHWKISVRIFLGFSILLCRGRSVFSSGLQKSHFRVPCLISSSVASSYSFPCPFTLSDEGDLQQVPNSFFKDYKLFLSPLFLFTNKASCHELFSPSPFEEKNKIDWSSCPYALLVPFILWWDMPIKRNTKWSMSNLLEMKCWLRLGSFFRERLLNFAARLVSNFWRANDKWMLLLEYSGSASSL